MIELAVEVEGNKGGLRVFGVLRLAGLYSRREGLARVGVPCVPPCGGASERVGRALNHNDMSQRDEVMMGARRLRDTDTVTHHDHDNNIASLTNSTYDTARRIGPSHSIHSQAHETSNASTAVTVATGSALRHLYPGHLRAPPSPTRRISPPLPAALIARV